MLLEVKIMDLFVRETKSDGKEAPGSQFPALYTFCFMMWVLVYGCVHILTILEVAWYHM